MRIHYCKSLVPNFGDDLNDWIWQELLGDYLNKYPEAILVGIGTIINHNVPQTEVKVVFGSGVGYGPVPKDIAGSNWRFYCVRGPLSAALLGIDNNLAVTDGAILLRLLDNYEVIPIEARTGISFMPHLSSSLSGRWSEVCKIAGINYLDPKQDSRELIREIASSKLLLAEAMHGAIVADTFRVPWIPIITCDEISTLKWLDWTSSMEIRYKPAIIGGSCLFERARGWKRKLLGQKGYALPWCDPDQFIAQFLNSDNFTETLHNRNTPQNIDNQIGIGRRATYRIAESINVFARSRILKDFSKISVFNILLRRIDAIVARYTAQELKLAAQGTSFLSTEDIFDEKLKRVKELLDDLRDDLERCAF